RPFIQVDEIRPEAEILVQQNRGVEVLHIEPLAASGDDHDRELQPLALVDTHDPDDIVVLSEYPGAAHITTAAPEPVDKVDEVEQAPVTSLFILPRTFEQHPQVGFPPGSAGKGSDIAVIAGFGEKL